MNYHLEDLNPQDFEKLVNSICQEILGMGVISFAEGRDGGRDGKFEGIANRFPSESHKWSGKFIIQAKYTSNPVAYCSDSDFTQIISKEIEKIKILKQNNEIDNYLLFTNRKYTGGKGEELLNLIKKKTNLENVTILGKETINSYLDSYPEIVKLYNLGLPQKFDFNDKEIKEVLISLKSHLTKNKEQISKEIEKIKRDFYHIEKKEKNQKNKLGEDYYQQRILNNSLLYFDNVKEFLENPINDKLKEYYEETAHELAEMILIKRNNFGAFEEIFVFIGQKIWENESSIKISKRNVSLILHYMYIECLIGIK